MGGVRVCRLFAIFGAAAVLAIGATSAVRSQQRTEPLTLTEIAPGLFVHVGNMALMTRTNEGAIANVGFVVGNDAVAVVDSGGSVREAHRLLAAIRSRTTKPIRYVLNTHQHGDHTGGNDAMMTANAQVVITKQARANMVAAKQPGLPQVTFTDEAQVFLGGKEVAAKYVGRGHTNGDAVILFPTERVIHMGDLYVSGIAPFCDSSAGGSIKEWDATIRRALALDFDKVIPGHGPVTTKADLTKWAQTLGTIRERVKSACAGGADDAAKRLDLKDLVTPFTGMRDMAGMCKELAQ